MGGCCLAKASIRVRNPTLAYARLTEWLRTGLQNRRQEFKPPTSLQSCSIVVSALGFGPLKGRYRVAQVQILTGQSGVVLEFGNMLGSKPMRRAFKSLRPQA